MIYFLHIHKVAGSTFIKLATKNGEQLHVPNENGNPYNENGKIIKFWDYSYDELCEFTVNKNYTLIANETCLKSFHRIDHLKYISIIRHPIDIIISNYHHVLLDREITLDDYLQSNDFYIKHPLTYYFSGGNDYQLALDRALNFDFILRTDKLKEDIYCMKELGWSILDTDKYRVGTRRNTNTVTELTKDLYDFLKERMASDIELYNEIHSKISFGKIKNH